MTNNSDYKPNIQDSLVPSEYGTFSHDPSSCILRNTNGLIELPSLPERTEWFHLKSGVLLPKSYELPKVHNPDISLRLIITAIRSPTQDITGHLCKLLQPQVGPSNTFIKEPVPFLEKMKTLSLQPLDIIGLLDIVSLCTRPPVKATPDHFREFLRKYITTLFPNNSTNKRTVQPQEIR